MSSDALKDKTDSLSTQGSRLARGEATYILAGQGVRTLTHPTPKGN